MTGGPQGGTGALAALGAAAVIALAGCEVVLGLGDLGVRGADASAVEGGSSEAGPMDATAGNDGASDAGAGDSGPVNCTEIFPPAQPVASDPNDAGNLANARFYVAIHTLDIGLGDGGGAALGYDLDWVNTCCAGGVPSCVDTTQAAASMEKHCDDPGGRDNAGTLLLPTLAALDPTLTAAAITQGIRVRAVHDPAAGQLLRGAGQRGLRRRGLLRLHRRGCGRRAGVGRARLLDSGSVDHDPRRGRPPARVRRGRLRERWPAGHRPDRPAHHGAPGSPRSVHPRAVGGRAERGRRARGRWRHLSTRKRHDRRAVEGLGHAAGPPGSPGRRPAHLRG